MRKKASWPQLFIQTAAALILTVLTGMFGAPFLRVIRRTQGAARYWTVGILLTAAMWIAGANLLAVTFGSIWLTLGVYSELEEFGTGWWIAACSAIVSGTVSGVAGLICILNGNKVTSWAGFVDVIKEGIKLLPPMGDSLKLDPEMLAQQTPSAWIVMLALCLGTALIFEDRLTSWMGFSRDKVASHLKLLEFRLPDYWLWITLTAFLLTMVDFGSKPLAIIGENVVNVSVILYFFQGLAILEVLLNAMKAGAFFRAVVYLVIVGQLFFLLSLVGLLDFWVDFRRRLSGKPEAPAGNDTRFGGSV